MSDDVHHFHTGGTTAMVFFELKDGSQIRVCLNPEADGIEVLGHGSKLVLHPRVSNEVIIRTERLR